MAAMAAMGTYGRRDWKSRCSPVLLDHKHKHCIEAATLDRKHFIEEFQRLSVCT